jgi:hypothetical protein
MSTTVVGEKRCAIHLLFSLLILPAALSGPAFGQGSAPIPANHIRIHYFRPDANYSGWTVYAFGQTTEDQGDFNGGPVQVAGQDGFGAYFDVGITAGATDVGIIIHKGNLKDPGPDGHINPSIQGHEFWQISGGNVLHVQQPPTIEVKTCVSIEEVFCTYRRVSPEASSWLRTKLKLRPGSKPHRPLNPSASFVRCPALSRRSPMTNAAPGWRKPGS